MASNNRILSSIAPWAGAYALGAAVAGLAVLAGGLYEPPERPAPPRPRGRQQRNAMPLRPAAYQAPAVSIRPPDILATAGRRAPEPAFRVELTNVTSNGTLAVWSASGLLVVDAASHRLIAQVPPNARHTVTARRVSAPGARLRIMSIDPATPMMTGKRSYVGALEARRGPAGLTVINEVRQEDYITGVVAGEAARSFPMEALKAQAVAARTYALAQRGNRGEDVDVVDTVADQVFTGSGVAWPECRRAVQDTAGLIATHNGRPIVAYFSADCGGATRTNVAGGLGQGSLPYLLAVRDAPNGGPDYCSVSPSHTWSKRLTAQDIAPKINAKLGADIRELTAIRFSRVYSDGRVGEVTVEGLGAPLPVVRQPQETVPPPTELRAPRPADAPETPAEPSPEGTAETAPPEAPAASLVPPPANTATDPETSQPETPAAPAPPERPVIRRSLPAFEFRRIVGTNMLRSQIMTVAAEAAGTWLFQGRGYGHGVGLCQWGACGMARQGTSFDRILKHYYTGIALEKNAPRHGILTGVLKDAQGKPVPGALVTLAGTNRDARTDAGGRFRFDNLPAATYDIVSITADNRSTVSFAWRVRQNQATDAPLTLAG